MKRSTCSEERSAVSGAHGRRSVASPPPMNVHPLASIADAQPKIEAWRIGYDQRRPHSSLGHLTTGEHVRQRQRQRVAIHSVSTKSGAAQTSTTAVRPAQRM